MKRNTAIILILISIIAFTSGCKSNLPNENTPTNEPDNSSESPTVEPNDDKESPTNSPDSENNTPVTTGALKTGLAVVTSLSKSNHAEQEDGLAQVDSTVVALTLDSDDRIVNCIIDGVQTKANFSIKGKLLTDITTVVPSKNELGSAYGMKKASSIGKEWNEEAASFASYVIGKTVEEVKGIAVKESGAPADSDMTASVTISVGDFIKAIEKAAAQAQVMNAVSNDQLGLGIITELSKSKDASDSEEGMVQADSNYAAVTTNEDGKITSCVIDSTQGTINFNGKGKISTDLNTEVKTKKEIGDSYNMIKASKIGKEWYQEVAAFENYVIGKTLEEVNGIAVTEQGVPSDTDLAASVTISIAGFNQVISKAVENPK